MTDSPFFAIGDNVLLVDERDRQYLLYVPPAEGPPLRLRGEKITSADLTALHDGDVLTTELRRRYLVLRPTLHEIVLNMPRQAQVIYPKDLALLLMWGDVAPGQRVIEVGCGHGALTMTLLRALGPSGALTTYDIRQDHLNRTRKNVSLYLGSEPLTRWTPVLGDPGAEGFKETQADRLFTDVPEPWTFTPAAAAALRPGGIWAAYLPTALQMMETVKAMNAHPSWSLAQAFEALQRWWHVRPPSLRPKHGMTGHTGFIVVGRRRFKEPNPEAEVGNPA
jgi:tRNA (adenine57-N1/adenine58-N1)-methyltransferase